MTRRAQIASSQSSKTKDTVVIRGLVSYRVHEVANLLSKGAALRYRREFDVSLWEWRTVALLGAYAPMSLNELAKSAALDKSQMSRVVSGLTGRGLVRSQPDERDGRGVQLSLTAAGVRLFAGLTRASNERNGVFVGCLTKQELACLDTVLEKLASQAKRLIDGEQRRSRTRVLTGAT